MKIEILGPGCGRCEALKTNAEQALRELGMTADVEKVTEMDRIVGCGVMATPGIVIDGELKAFLQNS
jgi:small redox-active disulfide protein 2